jgi:hypothetical protein
MDIVTGMHRKTAGFYARFVEIMQVEVGGVGRNPY